MVGHGSLNKSIYIYPEYSPKAKTRLDFAMLPRTVLSRFNRIPRPLSYRPRTLAPTVRPLSTSLPIFNSNSNSNSSSNTAPGRKIDDSEGKAERPKASHPTKHEPRPVSSGRPVAEHTKEDEKKRSGLPEQPDESESYLFWTGRADTFFFLSRAVENASASIVYAW